jgi:membrane-associated HD superfamily phosphohydrolase
MQCNMRNQCSGLFTCIMDYLYVLCTILMVLSCVLCMTLMVFVYFYYGLFACINLVDVMPLFSTIFFFPFTDFRQNSLDF